MPSINDYSHLYAAAAKEFRLPQEVERTPHEQKLHEMSQAYPRLWQAFMLKLSPSEKLNPDNPMVVDKWEQTLYGNSMQATATLEKIIANRNEMPHRNPEEFAHFVDEQKAALRSIPLDDLNLAHWGGF